MDPADRLLELVDRLYAAPGTEDGWQTFLHRFQGAMSGSAVTFISHDFGERHTSTAMTTVADAALMKQYRDHWGALDPWAYSRRLQRVEAGSVVLGDELIAHTEMKRTAFYNDFARHHDVVRCAVGMIERGPRVVSVISINASERRGPFDDHHAALLKRLMPHLHRALQIHRRLVAAESAAGTLERVLDHSSRAVMVADSQGRVRFMNRAASRLTAMRDGLTIERGEVRAACAADTMRLRAMVADAIKTSNSAGIGSGGTLVLGRPSGRRPFVVLVCPTSRRGPLVASIESAAALIFVSDPAQSVVPDEEMIKTVFHLTNAEAKLTRLLAQGASLADAEARLGVRRETVRSRLKTIFQKTGTHRQADLVRLVLTGTQF